MGKKTKRIACNLCGGEPKLTTIHGITGEIYGVGCSVCKNHAHWHRRISFAWCTWTRLNKKKEPRPRLDLSEIRKIAKLKQILKWNEVWEIETGSTEPNRIFSIEDPHCGYLILVYDGGTWSIENVRHDEICPFFNSEHGTLYPSYEAAMKGLTDGDH